jgi:hypothetical protein
MKLFFLLGMLARASFYDFLSANKQLKKHYRYLQTSKA